MKETTLSQKLSPTWEEVGRTYEAEMRRWLEATGKNQILAAQIRQQIRVFILGKGWDEASYEKIPEVPRNWPGRYVVDALLETVEVAKKISSVALSIDKEESDVELNFLLNPLSEDYLRGTVLHPTWPMSARRHRQKISVIHKDLREVWNPRVYYVQDTKLGFVRHQIEYFVPRELKYRSLSK